MSVFVVILVYIFLAFSRIRTAYGEIIHISPYSVSMKFQCEKNADQNYSEYGHFLGSVLDTKIFPQHTIADLNSGITFIVLFSQEKHLRWKERNTHTHWLHLLEILCNSNFSNHAQNIEVISHIRQRIGFQAKLYSIVTKLSFLPSFAITKKIYLEIWCNLPTDALVSRFSHTHIGDYAVFSSVKV